MEEILPIRIGVNRKIHFGGFVEETDFEILLGFVETRLELGRKSGEGNGGVHNDLLGLGA